MQKVAITLFIMINSFFGFSQFFNPENYPVYQGTDLGLTYSPASSTFKIWSPAAEKVSLVLYKTSLAGTPIETIEMQKGVQGTWAKSIARNLKGIYYAFKIYTHGKWLNEVPDPYAKAVGTNGKRAVVIDLKATNPLDWELDQSPVFSNRKNLSSQIGGLPTDAVVYEMHIRDFTIDKQCGVQARGKFLGLTEAATMNIAGVQTGLDHLQELGVTHVHLLPVYDFYSIDESKKDSNQYNWGYDPLNYNTPEGSYSSNPDDGVTRIKEFKQMVKALHQKKIRVVMDVVYNHTMLTENSYFNQLVPGYYYRQKEDGSFSNASACGNETASERPMMRKFMLESLKYWVKEYHVDGFRFDLMGIHDIETMNLISNELRAIKPDILLYGEGWTAGSSPLPDSLRALKKNAYQLSNIAVFSDDLRDAIKGSVFEQLDRGFATGKAGMEESIKFGITAACQHPQIDYSKVNYSKGPYAKNPSQVISYVDCHDNNILWDKLAISNASDTILARKAMQKLALTIVLTSQGIPFLHAGTEFLRSKKGVENSFNSSDEINKINWFDKADNFDVYQYVRSLISMRKDHPAFRLTTQKEIAALIDFKQAENGLIGYAINGKEAGDEWSKIFVVFNGSAKEQKAKVPEGNWSAFVWNNQVSGNGSTVNGEIALHPHAAAILYQK
ncbi:MAG: type I pullulanase [Bacteroidota bacterium]|jgi:pullulanase